MTQPSHTPTPVPVRIATWNLRYDSMPDAIPVAASLAALPDPCTVVSPPSHELRGELPWSARRVRVAQRLAASRVDLIGFQEALVRQVRDLEELMGSDFAWVGVGAGRDDGNLAGEFCPIFYRLTAFTLLESDTFWLSHEPFEPGSHFPRTLPRIATFALFRLTAGAGLEENENEKHVAMINLHLDNVNDAQRRLGAAMILHRVRYEAYKHKRTRPDGLPLPIFVTGDLNSSAKGSDSGAYAVLTGTVPAPAVPDEFARRFPLPSSSSSVVMVMNDLRGVAPRASVGGQWATFTGFEHRKDDAMCIDFVFGRSDDSGWEAKSVFVETALSDDGMLASDHRLVVADIVI